MRTSKFLILISFTLLLVIPLAAKAYAIKTGGSVYVGKNETISGNLFAAGSNITVDGRVIGDVICAGQAISINGKVDGDVICAGQAISINGEIGGSVRVAGNTININNKIARNAMAAGSSVILNKDAVVSWDMLTAGAFIDIRGKINGDLQGAGANIDIAGQIGKSVNLILNNKIRPQNTAFNMNKNEGLKIEKEAVIGGNVIYSDNNDAQIDQAATIKGEVTHKYPKTPEIRKYWGAWLWGRLIGFFAALVVGLVLITLGHKQIIRATDLMKEKIWPSLGWGLVVLFLLPIIVILMMVTMIGIPLALIILALWLIALYISKILVGIMIGRRLIGKVMPSKKDSLIWAMIGGIFILWIIISIPFIGWIISFLALLWGLGAIALFLKELK